AALYANIRGDYLSGAALADQALQTAQREGSPTSLGVVHQTSLQARFYPGNFVVAEEDFARARAFVESPDFPQIGTEAAVTVVTFALGSWNAWITGHADVARERVERMRQIMQRAQRNPYATAIAQIAEANLHVWLREFAWADALAGEALASAEEQGFPDA